LAPRLEAIDSTVAGLNKSVANLDAAVSEFRTWMNDAKRELQALDTMTTKFQEQFEHLQNAVLQATATVNALRDGVANQIQHEVAKALDGERSFSDLARAGGT
jgi:ABC-type transporter Mla subunit MlaD